MNILALLREKLFEANDFAAEHNSRGATDRASRCNLRSPEITLIHNCRKYDFQLSSL